MAVGSNQDIYENPESIWIIIESEIKWRKYSANI